MKDTVLTVRVCFNNESCDNGVEFPEIGFIASNTASKKVNIRPRPKAPANDGHTNHRKYAECGDGHFDLLFAFGIQFLLLVCVERKVLFDEQRRAPQPCRTLGQIADAPAMSGQLHLTHQSRSQRCPSQRRR